MTSSDVTATSAEVVSDEEEGRGIRVEGLRKTYEGGSIVAVENANINIEPDEFVTLLGPSGCGKTTILRSISGLVTPDKGDIFIGNRRVTEEQPKDRDLAFVFQENTLFPHMSVRENMRFGLDRTTDFPIEEKNERVKEVAEMLGIGGYLDRQPSDLSGGQQQRVSIGRAMVMEPDGFLLDEPFSDLDANLRAEMQTEVKQLQRDLHRPMIFVTHDQDEAMTISDKIVVMRDGVVQQTGDPHEVYTDPNNVFVARFIGTPNANFISADVVEKDGEMHLRSDLFTLDVPDHLTESLSSYVGETITLSIRPEYVSVVDDGDLETEVDLIENKGSDDTLYLQVNDTELRLSIPIGHGIEEKDIVEVEFDEDQLLAFDEDGERIR